MKPKLNYGKTLIVGFAFMSISAFWAVYDGAIPLMLTNTFGLSQGVTGAVMGIDNLLALFMLPLFGMLSDKTHTKLGRRTPYIIAGTALAVVAMILMPVFNNARNFVMFFVALGVTLIAMASYRSPAVAYMPDITPKPLRSKANGIINLTGGLGGALMMLITGWLVPKSDFPNYVPLFLFLAVFMVITVVLLVLVVNENKAVAQMREDSAVLGIDETGSDKDAEGNKIKMEPAVLKSFLFLLGSIFLWFFGYNAVISTFSRYALSSWGMELGASNRVLLIAQVAAMITFVPVGFLATRIGRKKTIMIGIVTISLAFAVAFLFTTPSMTVYILFAIAGIAWAFINVNSLPMVVDMCKGADVGKYTGFYYFASMSAQIVTPSIVGFLIDKFGMQVLFPYGCIFILLSFVTMVFVKHGDTRPEPPKVGAESFDVAD